MKNALRYDSPVMEFFSQMADLMILNIITLICMVPVVTIGAALTAMHSVLLRMVRNRETHVVQSYFQSFRDNFKQSTLLWGIMAVVGIGLILDLRIFRSTGGLSAAILSVILGAMGCFWYLTFLYLFPLQAKFENTKRETLRNALMMSIAAFPRTLGMLAGSILPLLMIWFFDGRCLPVLFLLGVSGPGYLSALLYSPYFERFETNNEETDNNSQ